MRFATRPQLAIEMLAVLAGQGISPPWAAADEVYGQDAKLRAYLERGGTGYVLGVPRSFRIMASPGRKIRADTVARLAPASAWMTASCGKGSKGDRDYAWAWLATASTRHTLLVRRHLRDPSADLAFFYWATRLPRGSRPASPP